jgi:hypothetical protein
MFGGNPGTNLNDLWNFNLSTKQWTWVNGSQYGNMPSIFGVQGVPASANVPSGRWGAVSWTDAAGRLWMWGGADSSGLRADLWSFDPSSGQWTWIAGPTASGNPGSYGTAGVAASSNLPPPRVRAAAWTDAAGNFWLFGGDPNNVGTLFNDLWSYSPTANQWTWYGGGQGPINDAGSATWPAARTDMAVISSPSAATFIYGGLSQFVNPGYGVIAYDGVWQFGQ